MSIIVQKVKGDIMKEIYGYKEKDVIGLTEFLQKRKGGTLTKAFSEYSKISGKSQGTVRNLYYAMAKKSKQDKEFCNQYLSGKSLSVSTALAFSEQEEFQLMQDILRQKINGKSVRSAILSLAGEDNRLALRYQNKYRNVVKNKPEMIKNILKSLKVGDSYNQADIKKISYKNSVYVLKNEINRLVERISEQVRKENYKLKAEIVRLKKQNQALKERGINKDENKTIEFFVKRRLTAKKEKNL